MKRRCTAVALLLLCAALTTASASRAQQDRDSSAASQHKTSSQAPPPEARIDINHASVAELLKVPGMTASWAGRIVRFRPYRTKVDLLDKGVLPSAVYDRVKDYIIAHRGEQ